MRRINVAVFNKDNTPHVYGIWQWDYGQVLRIQGLNLPSAVEIHFSLVETGGESATRIGVTKDGVTDVVIPDSMLEKNTTQNYYVYVYVYLTDDESGQTEYKCILHVTARPKPEGRTSDDTTTMAAILKAVNEIAERTGASDEKISEAVSNYLEANPIEESDPTVPEWAKNPEKPSYTAEEVGALPDNTQIPSKTSDLQNDSGFLTEHQDLSNYATKEEIPKTASDVGADAAGTADNKVATHNTALDAHSDIRLLIEGLTSRLNVLADSDDTTLDQMSEIVSYIKSNKSLIDAITTNKVSVSDIIDNLTTNVSNKPLSAAQGVALKALIDGIIVPKKLSELENDSGYANTTDIPEKLPNPQKLTFAGAVTAQYDGSAPVSVEIPEGGGASGDYIHIPASAEVGQTIVVKVVDENGKPTEWEAVDLPSGGGQAIDKILIKITETVHSISLIDDITLYNRIRANIKVVGDSANVASGVLGATTPSGVLINYMLNATKAVTGYLFFDLRLSEQGAESDVTPNFANHAYTAVALSHVYGLDRKRWTGALSLVPNATDWNFGAGTEIYLEAYRV